MSLTPMYVTCFLIYFMQFDALIETYVYPVSDIVSLGTPGIS